MAISVRQQSFGVGDGLALATGLAGFVWLAVSLWPGLGAPAWPSVSLGAVAVALGLRGGGRPIARGVGSVLGLCALVGGSLQIAALWGVLELLGRTER
jgi:hypothetical protein